MKKLNLLLSLIRIGNCITASLGTAMGLYFCNILQFSNLKLIFASLFSAFAITAFGNIDNDIIDIKTDIAEGKKRPLATGELSVFSAKILRCFFLLAGNAIMIFYPTMLFITLTASITLLAYNRYLKPTPLWGNLVVAFLTALTFLYGNTASIYVFGNFNFFYLPFVLAFFINLSREIIKDCQDLEGDKQSGHKTLPITKGIKFSKILSAISMIMLIISITVGFFINNYSLVLIVASVLLIIPASIFVIVKILASQTKKDFTTASKQLKFLMFIGLIALFLEKTYTALI